MIPMELVGVRVELPSNTPIVLLRTNDDETTNADAAHIHRRARSHLDRSRAGGRGTAAANDP